MTEPMPDSELAQHFRNNAVSSMPRAPLNAAISRIVAEDPDLRALLQHAPPAQRLPVLLLAALHACLLEVADGVPGAGDERAAHELVRWYPNLTDDPRPASDRRLAGALRDFVGAHRGRIVELIGTRHTQTNEVGRSALLIVAMGILDDELPDGTELAQLDVGASGGLNLLIDRLTYRYVPDDRHGDAPDDRHDGHDQGHHQGHDQGHDDGQDGVRVGGPSTVELEVHTRGRVPVPRRIPPFGARCGVDRHPVDITDADEARWLEACVWPDQTDRFERLRAVIEIARENPPELLAGDAVESLDPAVERMSRAGHVVVTNSWALNYLSPDDRARYATELDRLGCGTDLSWIFLESPGLTPELPWGAAPIDSALTGLNLVRWRDGERSVEHLARCHPHGYWMHWVD